MVFDSTLQLLLLFFFIASSAVINIHTRLRLMSSLVQMASESLGESVRSDAIRTRFCLWMNTLTRFGNVDRNWEIIIFSFFSLGIILRKRFVVFSFWNVIIRSLFQWTEWMIFRGRERLNTSDPTDTLQSCVSTFLPLNPQRNTSLKS